MRRRDFLKATAVGVVAASAPRLLADGRSVSPVSQRFDETFVTILEGFIRNAEKTARGFAVCNYPDGTILPGCSTATKKSFVSVARMLPPLSLWVASGRSDPVLSDGRKVEVWDVLRQTYTNAFNPKFEHYWGEPTGNKPSQRAVEATLVAMSLVRLGKDFVGGLKSEDRHNIQKWLASCTVFPERSNNHAWFSAVNQASRLRLSEHFDEFKGDENWMLADVKAMDALGKGTKEGWYSDSPDIPIYDYYNFWTFANFPLYWSQIIGAKYKDWDEKFRSRVKLFLRDVPFFFAADGSVPIFGRSLCYRWSLLAPMLVGYRLGLWPHSPALLRRIAGDNLNWWWKLGAYDEERGKLRETLTADGTTAVRDSYVDTGHPYWSMLGHETFPIPANDPLWTDKNELLPIERGDYIKRLPGPRMLVVGCKSSGQVRWFQARNQPKREPYRDQYNKFGYSSHFPFNMNREAKQAPWDQALVFRNTKTGECVARLAVKEGDLTEDGVQTQWSVKVGDVDCAITSRIRLEGEFEFRTHRLEFSGDAPEGWEAVEGSYPLGLSKEEKYKERVGKEPWHSIQNTANGSIVFVQKIVIDQVGEKTTESFGDGEARVNIVYPRMAVLTVACPLKGRKMTLRSVHYASPKPLPLVEIEDRAAELIRKWKDA